MEEKTKTSMGLEPNVAGLLCYVAGWLSGLIFYLVEKENKFVKFHAMQSIITFGAITVLQILIPVLRQILWLLLYRVAGLYVIAGIFSQLLGIISTIVSIGMVILWILLMIKAYQNETFKLPIAGKIAEKQLQ